VDSLKQKFCENPEAFSLEDVEIPKWFCRPGVKSKVARILAHFSTEVGGPACTLCRLSRQPSTCS